MDNKISLGSGQKNLYPSPDFKYCAQYKELSKQIDQSEDPKEKEKLSKLRMRVLRHGTISITEQTKIYDEASELSLSALMKKRDECSLKIKESEAEYDKLIETDYKDKELFQSVRNRVLIDRWENKVRLNCYDMAFKDYAKMNRDLIMQEVETVKREEIRGSLKELVSALEEF